MSTDTNIISPSKYNVYEKMLDLATNYFGEDTDYLKAGFLGWFMEVMALFMKDSAEQKMMLKNETNLYTAVMPKTIHAWAKQFGVALPKATPAHCDFILTFATSELDSLIAASSQSGLLDTSKYGSDVASLTRGAVIIDRKNGIHVGDLTYTIERSIIITKSASDSFIVKYCTTESETTKFGSFDETLLQTTLKEIDGETYLSFKVRAFQYNVVSGNKIITSSDFIDCENHTFAYTDQFCGMKLSYRKQNNTTTIPAYFSENEVKSSDTIYAYYDIFDDNELTVQFVPGVFLPSVGSSIMCDIYCTKGASANTGLDTLPVMGLSEESYRSLAILVSYAEHQSTGGKDKVGLDSLKRTIIRELSTRDVIVTEEDLNNYFSLLKGFFESINDGQVKFVKKKDDIIRRVFNAYVLLRDGLSTDGTTKASSAYRSQVVPTNTVDVKLGNNTNLLYVKRTSTNGRYDYEFVDTVNSYDTDIFRCPFKMLKYTNPDIIQYIYAMTDDSCALNYDATSNSGTSYIVPSLVSLKKDSNITNERYVLQFTFKTNFDLASSMTGKTVRLKIYNDMGAEELNVVPQCSSEVEEDSDLYTSTMTINLALNNMDNYALNSSSNYGQRLYVTSSGSSTTAIPVEQDAKIGVKIQTIIGNEAYEGEFVSDRKLAWFRNLDDIMSSDIKTINGVQYITEVPVISDSYYSSLNSSYVINTLMTYIDLLKDNKNKLETNTSFNMKFMNTCGESLNFTGTTTNIKLYLDIHTISDVDSSLATEMRHYIRHLVDQSNETGVLKVSTIIAIVSAAYMKYIDYIEFKGLNGTFNQYMEGLGDASESIVPEYFNLDRDTLTDCIRIIGPSGN